MTSLPKCSAGVEGCDGSYGHGHGGTPQTDFIKAALEHGVKVRSSLRREGMSVSHFHDYGIPPRYRSSGSIIVWWVIGAVVVLLAIAGAVLFFGGIKS